MSTLHTHPYVILDVFTDTPLEGNPVAVFTEAERLPDAVLPQLAAELNLSETVFLYPTDDPSVADARIRIFTPTAELPFAGHPVLGTAYVIAAREGLDVVRLQTGNGIVPVAMTRSGGALIDGEMSQPIPSWAPFPDPAAVLDALRQPASGLPIELYVNGPHHVMVDLGSVDAVAAVRPDQSALAALGGYGFYCFALAPDGTARARLFAVGLGVSEDPATGSAAGPLAVHLARHGRIPFGRPVPIAQGVEMGRPSRLRACAFGSADVIERVTVGGCAVPVAGGAFTLPTA